ncbi:MAG TPA: YeeE/YedE family protein, partial [Phaeodactylibacter sp.]|nr:YeeE/YedE family protein [Phaeodactylibacter sp.]
MIALVLFLLTWMGRKFGLSSLYRNVCTIAGAGKRNSFFDIDIRDEYWRMAFAAGAIVGGFIAAHFLASPEPVQISEATIQHLHKWGIAYPQGQGYIAREILNFSPRGVLFALLGGFFIGFGARYGSGCTSGHAITGLSHLQLPSLITVIGFF